MTVPITQVRLGDVVRLKKPHPCGANEWEVVRIGADIGLKCRGCDRKVMLVRSEFDRRFRGFIERHVADESPSRDGAAPSTPLGDSAEEAPESGNVSRRTQRDQRRP
jgi:hypothetical protein